MDVQRLKVLEMTGQQEKARVLGQGRDDNIGKTRMSAMGHCRIRDLARQPGGVRIEWQDAAAEAWALALLADRELAKEGAEPFRIDPLK